MGISGRNNSWSRDIAYLCYLVRDACSGITQHGMENMNPIKFKGYEKLLRAPRGWDVTKRGPCVDLPVLVQDDVCISFWKPTWRERLSLLLGKSVILYVASGQTQPPVALTTGEVEKA